jgi:hypothetical protein
MPISLLRPVHPLFRPCLWLVAQINRQGMLNLDASRLHPATIGVDLDAPPPGIA